MNIILVLKHLYIIKQFLVTISRKLKTIQNMNLNFGDKLEGLGKLQAADHADDKRQRRQHGCCARILRIHLP